MLLVNLLYYIGNRHSFRIDYHIHRNACLNRINQTVHHIYHTSLLYQEIQVNVLVNSISRRKPADY